MAENRNRMTLLAEKILREWRDEMPPRHAGCELGEACSYVDSTLMENIARTLRAVADEENEACERLANKDKTKCDFAASSMPEFKYLAAYDDGAADTKISIGSAVAARRKERE